MPTFSCQGIIYEEHYLEKTQVLKNYFMKKNQNAEKHL